MYEIDFFMKRIILLLATFYMKVITLIAQNDVQRLIQTDHGIYTVRKNEQGLEFIIFTTNDWDEITTGTKYVSEKLPQRKGIHVCIEIANKAQGLCKKGIGFNCSIYDCTGKNATRRLTNNRNRICPVLVRKKNHSIVEMIFKNPVDWKSLDRNF